MNEGGVVFAIEIEPWIAAAWMLKAFDSEGESDERTIPGATALRFTRVGIGMGVFDDKRKREEEGEQAEEEALL